MIKENKLFRSFKNNSRKQDGFIEDYAFVAQGLLDAFLALQRPEYLKKSKELVQYANQHFWDVNSGGYFTTSDLQEKLFQRLKDESDQSIPSATGALLNLSLKLSSLEDDPVHIENSEKIFKTYANDMEKNPYGFCSYLNALDSYLKGVRLIVVIYPEASDIKPWMEFLFKRFDPYSGCLFVYESDIENVSLPLVLKDKKTVNGDITVYICRNFTCSMPVTNLENLSKELNKTG